MNQAQINYLHRYNKKLDIDQYETYKQILYLLILRSPNMYELDSYSTNRHIFTDKIKRWIQINDFRQYGSFDNLYLHISMNLININDKLSNDWIMNVKSDITDIVLDTMRGIIPEDVLHVFIEHLENIK
jgi:hypothetical protein